MCIKKRILAIATLFLLAFSPILHAEEEEVKKVVFDLTTGDIPTFQKKVLSGIVAVTTYYQGNLQELQVAVVVHKKAYRFFIKELKHSPYSGEKALMKIQPELEKRLQSLIENYDVEFLLCEASLKTKKIDKKVLYPFVKTVFNSTVGLIDKQNDGYAYVPIH